MAKCKCDTCNGTGQAITSCCTGDVLSEDMPMCPKCHEWCGEMECPDCEGTGEVEEGTELSNVIDLIAQAENRYDESMGR